MEYSCFNYFIFARTTGKVGSRFWFILEKNCPCIISCVLLYKPHLQMLFISPFILAAATFSHLFLSCHVYFVCIKFILRNNIIRERTPFYTYWWEFLVIRDEGVSDFWVANGCVILRFYSHMQKLLLSYTKVNFLSASKFYPTWIWSWAK